MSVGYEVTLDTKDAREKLMRVSGKQFYKTVLRGTDATIGLILERLKKRLKTQEERWFQRRTVGIMNDFWRWARRLKAWPTTTNLITATAITQTRYALAVEEGGEYEQWVKDYNRKLTQAWGRPVRNPRTIPVQGHKRMYKQPARHYFRDVVQRSEADFGVPMERALRILLDEGRVATQAQMRKGLPR